MIAKSKAFGSQLASKRGQLCQAFPYIKGSLGVSMIMEQHAFKNENNCLNTNIYFFLEPSGGQRYNPYLNVVIFFNTRVKLKSVYKTAVFLHWCLICAVPLHECTHAMFSKYTRLLSYNWKLHVKNVYEINPWNHNGLPVGEQQQNSTFCLNDIFRFSQQGDFR